MRVNTAVKDLVTYILRNGRLVGAKSREPVSPYIDILQHVLLVANVYLALYVHRYTLSAWIKLVILQL